MGAFQFKQFKIEQERSAMKVNTDGVLLGAWMSIFSSYKRLLDVGTGSGVIALMAAQRISEIVSFSYEPNRPSGSNEVEITAIDIDEDSYLDAVDNFKNSIWGKNGSECVDGIKLEAKHCSFQDLCAMQGNGPQNIPIKKYDLIFSNPPYFINSLKAPDSARSNSRHTDTLSQGDLIKCTLDLLAPNGRLALVLPATESELLLNKIEFIKSHTPIGGNALHLARLCRVRTTEKKPAKRYLMEFVLADALKQVEVVETELVMQNGSSYTDQYRNLTKNFYINF